MNKEWQSLTRDLIGAKEREEQHKKRWEDIQNEYSCNEKELQELKTAFGGLQAKHAELILNYKEKNAKFEMQGDALVKIEKNRQILNEETGTLKNKIKYFEDQINDKERLMKIDRESSA